MRNPLLALQRRMLRVWATYQLFVTLLTEQDQLRRSVVRVIKLKRRPRPVTIERPHEV